MGTLGVRRPAAGREQLKGHLDLLLMSILQRSGPAHGYEIIALLRERSDGAFDLPEGTIYPALHRLESAGRCSSEWTTINGRRRRTYQLTEDGKAALAGERTAWTAFSRGIGSVIGASA